MNVRENKMWKPENFLQPVVLGKEQVSECLMEIYCPDL